MQSLWTKFQQFPAVFDDLTQGDYNQFLRSMVDRTAIYYELGDEVGIAAAVGIRPGLDAIVHLLCFDKRLKGREGVFRGILVEIFNKLLLRRVTALIPTDRWTSRVLARKLGFKKEGCMRQASLRRGQFRDVEIYGLLREELV